MRYLLLFLFGLSLTTLCAQRGNPASADSAALQTQFNELLAVSNNYQRFKVVRRDYLDAFMANVADSLSGYTVEIDRLNATIASQAERLEEQTNTISDREGSIDALTAEKDGMTWLGIPMSKATYRLIMWSAVIGLAVLLLLALGRMRLAVSSNRESEAKAAKLGEELEKSKRRRLEVEQNLRRQLQDEINKRNNV